LRALVISGGGSKAAFACGALSHLINDLGNDYQIMCGISSGAICCAFLSQFTTEERFLGAIQLSELWKNLKKSDIYKSWGILGRIQGIWKTSMYDSSPLMSLIKTHISLDKIRASGKYSSTGTVSLSSGKYHIFDQTNDKFLEAVVASATFPGMFTPVKFNGHLWIDGGLKTMSPLKDAIEAGATEIDLIITSPEIRVNKFLHKPTTVDVLKRAFDLSTDKIMANDLEKVEMYNKLASAGLIDKKIVKLTVIRPKHNLIEDMLDFKHETILEMMEAGYQEAKKINTP
jgi:predicted acylesterase/phospholipase RssA